MIKEVFVLGILFLFLVACAPQESLAGKAYTDLSYEQKQQYWACINECNKIGYTRGCALDCMAKAEKYAPDQNWCQDPDGKDYFTKNSVASNLYPVPKEDSCVTIGGKTYLLEGICSSNKYGWIQKNCAELGNYKCVEGACVVANHPPVLDQIEDQTITLGETISFTLTASDPDGDKLVFSGKIPKDSSLNKETGEFSWKPTAAGEYTLIFRVNDGKLYDKKYVGIVAVKPVNKECMYDDFSGISLDLSKWIEEKREDDPSFPDINEIYSEKGTYHIVTVTKGDKSVQLITIKTFDVGEVLEFDLIYNGGEGNHIAGFSGIVIDGKKIEPIQSYLKNNCPTPNPGCGRVGEFNGIPDVGSAKGKYHLKLEFLGDGIKSIIIRPDGSVIEHEYTGLKAPHQPIFLAMTGANGLMDFEFDNFDIPGCLEN